MAATGEVTVRINADAAPILAAVERVGDRLHELASSRDLEQIVARTAELREALEDIEARLARLASR